LDADVSEELRFHAEMKTRVTGDPNAAARAVGRSLPWRERARDAWGWRWLDDLTCDARYACRVLVRRDRASSIAAVVTLALAIGLNGVVFTIADAMLVRGFPLVKDNDRLVMVQEIFPSFARGVSFPDFDEWRAHARSFNDMCAVASGRRVAFRDQPSGRPVDLTIWTVTANTFRLLGVVPMLGRDFVRADEVAGAAPVVILSYRFWATRFGKNAAVVGSTVLVGGLPATVVGVIPERFEFPHQSNFWMPAVRTPELERRGAGGGGYVAFGRLRPGATVEQARVELQTIHRRLQAAFPETNRDLQIDVVDNAHDHAGPNGPLVFGSLWVGACFVLLIACANVSNLTLVRTIGRAREFATRIALGAGLWRMLRQVVIESTVLASAAGVIGWWITSVGVRVWADATASPFQVADYSLNIRTPVYVIAITFLAAVLFSLGPLWHIARLRAGGTLTAAGRGVTLPVRSRRLAAMLVAAQMALAIVLLSGAGVLVRSLVNIVGADTGVRAPEQILVATIRLPSEKFATDEDRREYLERLNADVPAVAGIQGASLASALPAQGGQVQSFEFDGVPPPATGEQHVQVIAVTPEYCRVLDASTTAGRAFTSDDRATSSRVAVVNQAFVEKFLPDAQPIGARVRVAAPRQPRELRQVVGVVSNILEGDAIRQQFKPVLYVPMAQSPLPLVHVLARARVSTDQVARALRANIERLDADITIEALMTLKASFAFDGDYMDLDHMELGKGAAAAPTFAVVALVLAAIGLYAVIAHSVSQRTQEIGVRIAIGAAARDIRALVFRDGMTPVALGIVAGLAASLASNRLLQSQLVGVSPFDPATIIGALLLLTIVALMACGVPARRAIRVNPVVALRQE
jgi:putative ABC transport system permease protein